MKKIKLMQLSVENFKGLTSFTFAPEGHDADIRGANGSGKSTLVDAWCWLLFGKDSHGAVDFAIKPLDSTGEVRNHAAVTAVEACIDVDDRSVKLRREYSEKWSKKRGKSEATYDGNVSNFYIDDVPVKKSEFDERVTKLIASEHVFVLLTRLYAFSESLAWQKRREMLLALAGAKSDIELMKSDERFAELADLVGEGTLDDLKRRLMSQRKRVSADINDLPKRLDELARMLDGMSGCDFDRLDERQAEAEARREAAEERVARIAAGSEVTSARAAVVELESELKSLNAEQSEYRAKQFAEQSGPDEKIAGLEKRACALGWDLDEAKHELGRLEEHIAELTEKVEDCRSRYRVAYAEKLPDDSTRCPTCGRSYDHATQQKAAETFEAAKAAKLLELVDEGSKLSAKLENSKTAHEVAEGKLQGLETAIAENAAMLDEAKKSRVAPVISDPPGWQERYNELSAKLDTARAAYSRASGDVKAAATEAEGEAERARSDLKSIAELVAKKELNGHLLERKAGLEKKRGELAVEQENCDRLLALADDFTRYRISAIEADIDSHFKLARWKLFDVQVNSGVVDCCEATYNGVPYSDVNSAMRANLGVDITSAISAHYGLSVPLFCDNAESVSEYQPIDTQVIKLYVAPECDELKVEVK